MKNILKNNFPKSSMAVYVKPTLPVIDIESLEEIKKLRDGVVLECQGDFVQFDSTNPLIESMIAFDAVRPYCSEVVVKNGNNIIGIYDRHNADVIRSVVTRFVIYPNNEDVSEDLLSESVFDIAFLWKESTGSDEYEKINNVLKVVFDKYKPSRIVTLIDTAPIAMILAFQSMFYGVCIELWYQPFAKSKKSIRIF